MKDERAMAASIRQRLLNLSKERGEDYNFLLTRYAGLRFLHRLSLSAHAGNFILKGATMFLVWDGSTHRPTRDIDLLGDLTADEPQVEQMIKNICSVEVEPDSITYDLQSIKAEAIRENASYSGIRVGVIALIGTARVPLQIDIGFGDTVMPAPVEVFLPNLLNESTETRIRAYPVESVVAEKFEAIVSLGLANSRMKDYYDLGRIAATHQISAETLALAITETFKRRQTILPSELPIGLTQEFFAGQSQKTQWAAFLNRSQLSGESLEDACQQISRFLSPILSAIAANNQTRLVWTKNAWK